MKLLSVIGRNLFIILNNRLGALFLLLQITCRNYSGSSCFFSNFAYNF